MEKFCDEKQQKMLDSFYGEMKTWSPESYGYRMLCWIAVLFTTIFVCFPWQVILCDDDIHFMLMYLCLFAIMQGVFYVRPYICFKENRKDTALCKKLKFLPVSLAEVRIYSLRKSLRFQSKLLAVHMVGQLLFTVIAGCGIGIGNLLYPVVIGFVVPIVAAGLEVSMVK